MQKRMFRLLAAVGVALLCAACAIRPEPERPTVHIAVPYEAQLYGINEEYYKTWLEEQAGLNIEFTFFPQSYTKEYLRMLLSEQQGEIDAVFFSQESALPAEELAEYGAKGNLAALESLIDEQGVYLPEAFEAHVEYNLRQAMTAADGHIYYMPSLLESSAAESFQTLWINAEWLEELGLTIPATTEEFAQVLAAFAQHHPDGAPLIGSSDKESMFACNFLMNAFTVCDPENAYMAVQNGSIVFSPITEEWRAGLQYCHSLFEAELLPAQNFTYTPEQLSGFCNDPRNLAGAFAAKRMSDVLSGQSPQLISRYLAVPPLAGPERAGVAVVETALPRPGGVILASSEHREAVFRLMDSMCSSEAYRIGHYGEPGVDWDVAEVGDITINGEPADIAIKSTDRLRRTESTPHVVGPFLAHPEYADKIAWKGYQVNQSEYLEARAFRMYQPYVPKEYVRTILFSEDVQAKRKQLQSAAAYTKAWMADFITGAEDVEDDAAWARYLQGFSQFHVEELVAAVQRSYNGMER